MINPRYFFEDRVLPFVKERIFLVLGLMLITAAIGGYFVWPQMAGFFWTKGEVAGEKSQKVDAPAIINGELVLPEVYSGGVLQSKDKIQVLSAFLVGVFDEGSSEPPKLVGIRILGELANLSTSIVKEISPVIRFYDEKDKLIAQKIAKVTPGFDFFSFRPKENTLYDILVLDPPKADKLEIVVNAAGAEKTPSFEKVKILSPKMEVKTAKFQPQASGSAEEIPTDSEVEYYTVSGMVENNLIDPIADLTVYAWVKNSEGKVFSMGRQDFKGDLISPKKQVEFKINLLPFKTSEKMDKFEVQAFGKRYKL